MAHLCDAILTVGRSAGRTGNEGSWASLDNLHVEWDKRTRALAAFIQDNVSVLEFGAGRRVLEQFLPDDCRYIPSDIVDRGGGTIACNLNLMPLPAFPPFNVVVFSGVLDWVNDVPFLTGHLGAACTTVAASSAPATDRSFRSLMRRRRHGWVNDYDLGELTALFAVAGFQCRQEQRVMGQEIMLFSRPAVAA